MSLGSVYERAMSKTGVKRGERTTAAPVRAQSHLEAAVNALETGDMIAARQQARLALAGAETLDKASLTTLARQLVPSGPEQASATPQSLAQWVLDRTRTPVQAYLYAAAAAAVVVVLVVLAVARS